MKKKKTIGISLNKSKVSELNRSAQNTILGGTDPSIGMTCAPTICRPCTSGATHQICRIEND